MSFRSEVIRIINEFLAGSKKISELPSATTPLAGTELAEIVQNGVNKKVATSNFGGGGGGSLTDGNGTTANGTAVDLGGDINQNTLIEDDVAGTHTIAIGAVRRLAGLSLNADEIAHNTDLLTETVGDYVLTATNDVTIDGTNVIINGVNANTFLAGLANGNGTTANGNAVDLGGPITANISIPDPANDKSFLIGDTSPLGEFSAYAGIIALDASSSFTFYNNGSQNTSIGPNNITFSQRAVFRAGTATANTYPWRVPSGPLLTSAVPGVFEFLTDKAYFTITTGGARKEFTLNDIALTSGRIPFLTTNGRLTDHASLTYSSTTGISLTVAGTGLSLKEGTNASMGRAVLVGGTVTVNTTFVESSSEIFLTNRITGGTPGLLSVGTVTNGTSFVINSASGTDTSTISWLIVRAAP